MLLRYVYPKNKHKELQNTSFKICLKNTDRERITYHGKNRTGQRN